MKTDKQTYIAPQTERIELDNEIELQLESSTTPPTSSCSISMAVSSELRKLELSCRINLTNLGPFDRPPGPIQP